MGLGTYLSDEVFGGAVRRRQKEAPDMAKELITKGLEPDTVNSVVNNYVQTGDFKIPSMQTKALPNDLSSSDVMDRTTREPVSFAPKKEQLYSFDSESGTYLKGPQETDNVKPVVNKFDPGTKGYDIKINQEDGTEIERKPNGMKRNQYIYIKPHHDSAGGGSKTPTPQQRWALTTLSNAQQMQAKGSLTPEMNDQVGVAAQILGMDTEEALADQTIGQRLQQVGSQVAPKIVPPPQPNPGVRKVVPAGGRAPNPKMPDAMANDMMAAKRYIAQNQNSPQAVAEAARRLKAKYGNQFKGF